MTSGGRLVVETSRPIAQVAKDLGINSGTLGNWVNTYRREHVGEEPALGVSERAEPAELRRRTRELEQENLFLKKSCSVLCQGSSVSDKSEFIDAEHAATTTNTETALSIVKCVHS
jgi:transposase